MSAKENMEQGKLYSPLDAEIRNINRNARELCREFNQTDAFETPKREEILGKLLGKCGEQVYILPPFYCDYGYRIEIGKNVFVNVNCMMLDCGGIKIGNDVLIGPNVGLYAVGHPLDAEVRETGYESGSPICIGDRVWIGGSCVINQGVSIGENSVIGSGSVVVKDIPANVVAAGNPCRVLRKITQDDKKYWRKRLAEEAGIEMNGDIDKMSKNG